jgi:hypothetical protein
VVVNGRRSAWLTESVKGIGLQEVDDGDGNSDSVVDEPCIEDARGMKMQPCSRAGGRCARRGFETTFRTYARTAACRRRGLDLGDPVR